MKILSRKEFLELPSGIIYSEYKSLGMVSGLYQKERSLNNDWYYRDLLGEVEAQDSGELADIFFGAEDGKEFVLDYECVNRDGFFQDDDFFIVYDKEDVSRLIQHLTTVLGGYE